MTLVKNHDSQLYMLVDESPGNYMGGKKNGYDVFSSRI